MDKLSLPIPQMRDAGNSIIRETWGLNIDTQQSLHKLRDDINPMPHLVQESIGQFLNSAQEKLTEVRDQSFNIGNAILAAVAEAETAEEHIAGTFDSQPAIPMQTKIRTF